MISKRIIKQSISMKRESKWIMLVRQEGMAIRRQRKLWRNKINYYILNYF
jgi:hypothetical protein